MTSSNYFIPKTEFTHSLDLESRRLLFLAAKLPTNVLQNRGFLVLPKLPPVPLKSCIIFPDLAYSGIPNFWTRCARLKLSTPIQAPNKLISETSNIVRHEYQVTRYNRAQNRLLVEWQGLEKLFWHNLFTLFPEQVGRVKRVNIYLTQYGSLTSFSLISQNVDTIHIYARLDCQLYKLIWTILASLFRDSMETELKYTWYEIEAVIDWLTHKSSLNPAKTSAIPTVTSLRSTQLAYYQQKSREYLRSLNLPTLGHSWIKTGDIIYYGDKKVTNLSHNEQLLLEVLLAKQGETVKYETIIVNVWGENAVMSDWAITKQVQRLRDKLTAHNIPRSVIQAHRKTGYCLV